MADMPIAVLVGSLRRESFNRRLAQALEKLAPPGFSFSHPEIGDLPLYNQDDDAAPSAQVVRLKGEIAAAKGILFDGRVAEDFKLMSGTWVPVGALRLDIIDAASPIIQDAVITGHDREEVGVLGFASLPGCLKLCPDAAPDTPLKDLITRPEVRNHLAKALKSLAAQGKGSSHRVARALLMDEPPSIDANEITDKGYINQRAVLTCRADLVERLYAESDAPEVVRLA